MEHQFIRSTNPKAFLLLCGVVLTLLLIYRCSTPVIVQVDNPTTTCEGPQSVRIEETSKGKISQADASLGNIPHVDSSKNSDLEANVTNANTSRSDTSKDISRDDASRGDKSHSEGSPLGDVCGPFGAESWQSLYSKHHDDVLAGRLPPKALVWECTDRFCGGLGDRMKGIYVAFVVALSTGRAFFIHQDHPADVSFALVPKSIAWNVRPLPREACEGAGPFPRSCDFAANASGFAKVFGDVYGSSKDDSTKPKRSQFSSYDIDGDNTASFPEFLRSLDFGKDTIRIRTNRRATFDEMIAAVGDENLLADWAEAIDAKKSRLLLRALNATNSTFAFPCIAHFLFGLSPALKNRMTELAIRAFDIRPRGEGERIGSDLASDVLPFRTFGMAPLPSQRPEDSFALTFAEHFVFTECASTSEASRNS